MRPVVAMNVPSGTRRFRSAALANTVPSKNKMSSNEGTKRSVNRLMGRIIEIIRRKRATTHESLTTLYTLRAATRISLQRRIVGRAHHEDFGIQCYGILCPQFNPLRVSLEGGPGGIPGCAVLMCKQVDQCVGIIEALPCAKNLHAVLLEYIDFAVAKPFVQIVDTALAGIDRIHPQLKTARILRGVYYHIDRNFRTVCHVWGMHVV